MKSIREGVNKFKDIPQDVFRKSAKELLNKVIDRTPVDTGLLVNSWIPTLRRPSKRIIKTTDKTRKKAKQRVEKVVDQVPVHGGMFFTNNQPYSVIIEMGRKEGPPASGSHQAPAGMMRISAAEWESIVKRNLRDRPVRIRGRKR